MDKTDTLMNENVLMEEPLFIRAYGAAVAGREDLVPYLEAHWAYLDSVRDAVKNKDIAERAEIIQEHSGRIRGSQRHKMFEYSSELIAEADKFYEDIEKGRWPAGIPNEPATQPARPVSETSAPPVTPPVAPAPNNDRAPTPPPEAVAASVPPKEAPDVTESITLNGDSPDPFAARIDLALIDKDTLFFNVYSNLHRGEEQKNTPYAERTSAYMAARGDFVERITHALDKQDLSAAQRTEMIFKVNAIHNDARKAFFFDADRDYFVDRVALNMVDGIDRGAVAELGNLATAPSGDSIFSPNAAPAIAAKPMETASAHLMASLPDPRVKEPENTLPPEETPFFKALATLPEDELKYVQADKRYLDYVRDAYEDEPIATRVAAIREHSESRSENIRDVWLEDSADLKARADDFYKKLEAGATPLVAETAPDDIENVALKEPVGENVPPPPAAQIIAEAPAPPVAPAPVVPDDSRNIILTSFNPASLRPLSFASNAVMGPPSGAPASFMPGYAEQPAFIASVVNNGGSESPPIDLTAHAKHAAIPPADKESPPIERPSPAEPTVVALHTPEEPIFEAPVEEKRFAIKGNITLTIQRAAKEYGVKLSDRGAFLLTDKVAELNDIVDKNRIQAGREISIPRSLFIKDQDPSIQTAGIQGPDVGAPFSAAAANIPVPTPRPEYHASQPDDEKHASLPDSAPVPARSPLFS